MTLIETLKPHLPAGMKLAKSFVKAAVRAKASPVVAAIAALEVISTATSQTETYMPAFLADFASEMHRVQEAQKEAALLAANPDQPPTGDAT